jgi:hypothetical protein
VIPAPAAALPAKQGEAMTQEPYNFAVLREELDKGIRELEGRLERAGNIGDDTTTLAYRQHITFFNIARGFAEALAKDPSKRRRVEHGIVVLRLEGQR